MTSREVAEWLIKRATDKEFVDTFMYMYYATGRGIPDELPTQPNKEDIQEVLQKIENISKKIIEEIKV